MMNRMVRKHKATVWMSKGALILPLFCLAMACKSEVTISMNGNVPPAFTFQRGRYAHVNYLDFFSVEEVAPENQKVPYMSQDPDQNRVIWQIWPKTTAEGRLDDLPTIVYGEVPPGFVQKIPEQGVTPALVEGRVYEAGGPPVIMSRGFLRFLIKDGKAVQLPIPGRE